MSRGRLVRFPQRLPIIQGCANIHGIIDNPRVWDINGQELSFAFVYQFDDTWIILHDNGEGIFESSYSENFEKHGFPHYTHFTNFSKFAHPVGVISLDGIPAELSYDAINIELLGGTEPCYVFVD